jgi:hypothetical protein
VTDDFRAHREWISSAAFPCPEPALRGRTGSSHPAPGHGGATAGLEHPDYFPAIDREWLSTKSAAELGLRRWS